MRTVRWQGIVIMALAAAAAAMFAVGCAGDDGSDGTSCSVTTGDDGAISIDCTDGTSVVVPPGADGMDGEDGVAGDDGAAGDAGDDGTSCTVEDNEDGTSTISCDDGTEVIVSDGEDIDPEVAQDLLDALNPALHVEPEACMSCHNGAGEEHQEHYDDYTDETQLELSLLDLVSEEVAEGEFDAVLTFTIAENGFPYVDLDGLPNMDQKRFYVARVDADGFINTRPPSFGSFTATETPGEYTATASGISFAPEDTNSFVYAYIANTPIHAETPPGSHVHLYGNVASAALTFGEEAVREPSASVDGCERCHGEPYMKHGYRNPIVDGLPDFGSCRSCHYDTRNGNHIDWQILAADPERYAEIDGGSPITDDEREEFAYTANLMNDVHMAHSMEFPYPQSMSNCTVCHEDQLDDVLAPENFTITTCKSCHPVAGENERSLENIWDRAEVGGFHSATADCQDCHSGDSENPQMADLHNGGYFPTIYSEGGEARFSDVLVASIDDATWDASTYTLTVFFSTEEIGGVDAIDGFDADDIVPTLLVGPYGYDTKDFIVPPHGRDADRNRLLEWTVGTTNPRFTLVTDDGDSWEVDVDLSMWSDMVDDDIIRRAEIAVLPGATVVVGDADVDVGTCDPSCGRGFYCSSDDECVEDDDYMLGLDAPSRTFDLDADDFDDAFFGDIVDVANCNNCHEQLATTFHSGNRGGNVTVCRMCHVTTSGGSHLEMQSRSIDSYVHAIHSFQAFDPGDIDFDDPVEALEYNLHINHRIPTFTITNCEACHNEGTYDPPDQARSMPGLLSGSDDVEGRNIQDVDPQITGPGARACGSCHRSMAINDDNAAFLNAQYRHWDVNGYVVENADGALDTVIETIMSMFPNR